VNLKILKAWLSLLASKSIYTMKKFSFNHFILKLLAVALLASCEAVFVPDPIDPRLPKYTEDGNDVAGALVDGDIWKNYYKNLFFTSYYLLQIEAYQPDSLIMFFEGSIQEEPVTFEFHLKGFQIFSFNDLSNLHNKKIFLDGTIQKALYKKWDAEMHTTSAFDNGTGQLYVKNVAFYDSSTRATISGTFGFTVTDSLGLPVEISYGRFDYKVSDSSNFGYYEGNER